MPPELTAPLERYFSTGDEAAFAEVVKSHLPLVFSAAMRISRDRSQAEDISQTVFSRLAGLRSGLPEGVPLAAWLHRTTRTAALNAVRSESRRQRREEIAISLAMNEARFPWEKISPVLDEVIGKLTPEDRELVLSRFFVGETPEEMARRLGVGHEAVKKRLQRALGRLRDHLGRCGIQTTTAALALSLPAYGVETIGVTLPAAIASAAIASPIAPSAFTALTALLMKKSLTISVLAILATGSIWLGSQARSAAALEGKIADLRQRLAAAGTLATTSGPAGRGTAAAAARIDWRHFIETRTTSGDQIELKRMTDEIDRHLAEMTAEGLSGELDRLAALGMKEEDQLDIEALLLRYLTGKDPALALHHLEGQLADDRMSYPTFTAYRKWLTEDPAGAIRWLDAQGAEGKFVTTTLEEANPTQKWLEASVLPYLLTHDPAAAPARLLALSPAQRRAVLAVAEIPPGAEDQATELRRAVLPVETPAR